MTRKEAFTRLNEKYLENPTAGKIDLRIVKKIFEEIYDDQESRDQKTFMLVDNLDKKIKDCGNILGVS